MKAMLYERTGGAEVLQYVDVADPTPGPADVVVRVEACALNRLDVVQRNGWFHLPMFSLPHIAGMDVAGTVVAIGANVDTVAVGARVVIDPSLAGVAADSKLAGMGDLYGDLGIIGATVNGGYAELCLAPATHVYPVPDDMPIEQRGHFSNVLSDRITCAVRDGQAAGWRDAADPRGRFRPVGGGNPVGQTRRCNGPRDSRHRRQM